MMRPGRSGDRVAGVSLVELMVALTIGLVLIGGAITAYLKARDTLAAAEAAARLQENARYALSLIEADVRMAGFWGLNSRPDLIRSNATSAFPAACGAAWTTDVMRYLTGYDDAYAAPCAALGGGAQPNADVLIVRRASAQRIAPQSALVGADNRDRVLIVTNRVAGEIFVPKDLANSIPPGFATSDPHGGPPLADTRELLVDAYYVSRNSSVANGYPALRRKHLVAGPSVADEELVPGVEDLQFRIGIDANGDGSADRFVDPGMVPAGSTPVAARIWLRLRAQERDPAYTGPQAFESAGHSVSLGDDHFRRLLIVKTLQLRNAGA
jgi:type IV pilus assembly protein PilW